MKVPVVDIIKFLENHPADIIKIDCEGCEYSIIPRLIESEYIQNIKGC
ncbi:FkbM family methyltransferase [Pyrococcus woesei]